MSDKIPIYRLGAADPIDFYRGPGGLMSGKHGPITWIPDAIDIKVTFEEDGKEKIILLANSLEYEDLYDIGIPKIAYGTVKVYLSGDKPPNYLLGKTGRLQALATCEYGWLWSYFDAKITFLEFHTSISVDSPFVVGEYKFSIIEPFETGSIISKEDIMQVEYKMSRNYGKRQQEQEYILGVIKQLEDNVMICTPRRFGKTTMICKIVNWAEKNDKMLLIIVPRLVGIDELNKRIDSKNILCVKSATSLRGRKQQNMLIKDDLAILKDYRHIFPEPDIVLIEEASFVKDDVLRFIYDNFFVSKIISFLTPKPYNRGETPYSKELWNTSTCIKLQVEGDFPLEEKNSYTLEDWQTEAEGNWMVI